MTSQTVDAAFSPCPNDTYMFYAWVHSLVGNIACQSHLFDIQTLNESLSKQVFRLTKASTISAFKHSKHYEILPVGAALGFGCGPLVVGKFPLKKVAIPGKDTVAHLLFDLFLEGSYEKVFTTYDKIFSMIEEGIVDGGVIIHESRFIFESRGHQKLYDLGDLWEKKSKLPLPLGVLLIDKHFKQSGNLIQTLKESIYYAKNHFKEAYPYISTLSQEKDETVIKKHIELYVNEESYQLSQVGRKSIETLFHAAKKKGLLNDEAALRFCNPA